MGVEICYAGTGLRDRHDRPWAGFALSSTLMKAPTRKGNAGKLNTETVARREET